MIEIKKEQIIVDLTRLGYADLLNAINTESIPVGTTIKLGQSFFERNDKLAISFCEEAGYPVFADRKINDTPDEVLEIANTYLEHAPSMLSIMANAVSTEISPICVCRPMGAGSAVSKDKYDAIRRFSDLCRRNKARPAVVTLLSSKTDETIKREYLRDRVDLGHYYFDTAYECEATDIIASLSEVEYYSKVPKYSGLNFITEVSMFSDKLPSPAEAFSSNANQIIVTDIANGEDEICKRLHKNYMILVDTLAQKNVAVTFDDMADAM